MITAPAGVTDGRGHRRRLLALMRRERALADRTAAAQAAGVDLSRLSHSTAECWALRWAIEELSRLYPEAAARAGRDLEREVLRRRTREGPKRP